MTKRGSWRFELETVPGTGTGTVCSLYCRTMLSFGVNAQAFQAELENFKILVPVPGTRYITRNLLVREAQLVHM